MHFFAEERVLPKTKEIIKVSLKIIRKQTITTKFNANLTLLIKLNF
jgi:hypothetical protein